MDSGNAQRKAAVMRGIGADQSCEFGHVWRAWSLVAFVPHWRRIAQTTVTRGSVVTLPDFSQTDTVSQVYQFWRDVADPLLGCRRFLPHDNHLACHQLRYTVITILPKCAALSIYLRTSRVNAKIDTPPVTCTRIVSPALVLPFVIWPCQAVTAAHSRVAASSYKK